MPQILTIPGLPMSLQNDGWWLTDPAPDHTTTRIKGPIPQLLALLLLADLLFWHHAPGLSLAIFAAATFAATSTRRPRPLALIALTLTTLPVIDHVQPLSLAILAAGLPASIALNRGQSPLPALLTLLKRLPLAAPTDAHRALKALPGLPTRSLLRNWAFPLGGTLILLSLLTQANPILANWLSTLTNLPLNPTQLTLRALFWAGLALILWPLLTEAPTTPLPHIPLPKTRLNAASVTNALILFNAVLALQTALDARYLWTGTAPQGMTLATYAHRGAYPLLATALLAGAFAIAAKPWLHERPLLKPLLLLWLAQNVALTLSALYRLDLYIDTFGLTYLRAYAAIWMALVAAGLALTALNRPTGWLLTRCALLGLTTLYLCAFVNFAAVIAQTNTANHHNDAYLCTLGPTAAADTPLCPPNPPHITNWRDWGFRNWRVLHTLRGQEAVHEDPRRG